MRRTVILGLVLAGCGSPRAPMAEPVDEPGCDVLVTHTDGAGTFSHRWRYDSQGRLFAARTQLQYYRPALLSFAYDEAGRLRVMDYDSSYQGHQRAELTYDRDGRLERVRRRPAGAVRYSYDDAGRLVRSRSRTMDRRLTYEGDRLVAIEWRSSFGRHRRVIDRDRSGRIETIRLTFRGPADEVFRESYRHALRYDGLSRLVRMDVTYPDRESGEMRGWFYDETGRLTRATRATVSGGRDVGDNPTDFLYDEQGRLTRSESAGGASTRVYRYEGNCQLVDTAPRAATPLELADGMPCASILLGRACFPGGLSPLGGVWGI